MGADELTSRFGEPEAVYRPSPGQTAAGVIVGAGATAALFVAGGFGSGLNATNRVGAVLLGLATAGLTFWLYRQRQWRLVIFRGGLVQVRPGGVDELLWAEVREVVRTRLKEFGERTTGVTFVGAHSRMVVSPVNYQAQAKLFETLLAAAERRGVPIRVDWQEVD